MLAPLLGTAFYALGGFMATFMYVGVGYLLICPFMYRQLYQARDLFFAERDRLNNLPEDEELLGLIENQTVKTLRS